MSNLLRHNISIPVVMTATGQFTSFLACPFVPDELKCKNLTFYHTNGTAGVFTLRLDGLGTQSATILGAVVDACTTFSGITIPVPNFNAGTYTFTMFNGDGSIATGLVGARLNALLEFRRYTIRL